MPKISLQLSVEILLLVFGSRTGFSTLKYDHIYQITAQQRHDMKYDNCLQSNFFTLRARILMLHSVRIGRMNDGREN